ncbi:zinc finger protein pita-like isoform X2 [Armigeres subalbatus]|uniref:zinc finger protein pita-like isoform X2 n=1 Tax=Armigeres subalbatus TaxID=124917 RepID=UPI002ED05BAE
MAEKDSKDTSRAHKVCRLCLSEESLEDIFKESSLPLCISDFLSIEVSIKDKLSHAICAICRIRLTEFRDFQTRCNEVQDVLRQKMAQNDDNDARVQKHSCRTCGKHFSTRQLMEWHFETHKPDRTDALQKYSISVLNEYATLEAAQKAAEEYHLSFQYQCKVCHKLFKSKRHLCNHMTIHKPKRFDCKYCDKTFPKFEETRDISYKRRFATAGESRADWGSTGFERASSCEDQRKERCQRSS